MDYAIPAHGGVLVNQELSTKEAEDIDLSSYPTVTLDSRQVSDVEMIAVGAFSPLRGFMGRTDYESVVDNMRLINGLPWTLPVKLTVSAERAEEFKLDSEIALKAADGPAAAVMVLREKYKYDKEKEALKVYGTKDTAHPGVAYLYREGEVALAGEIRLLSRPLTEAAYRDYRLDPAESRRLFKEKGWRRIVGFQTRNPVHRAHEYIQKCALETVDGLFLHPLVGATKKDDVPAALRMRCYLALLDKYYPKDRVVLGVLPAAMRYAGPREAVFHALVRKNYGCTHFIVGRDHAGVGDFYGSFDAHYIFDEFRPEELGITPLFFDYTFYCRACGGMASYKTCPHDAEEHISLSGTKVREMLRAGKLPPPEFSRPEVAEILLEGMSEA